MTADLPVEVRARIDAHLDAVEQQLVVSGMPREKRRGIVDDLETHILEMIDASQSGAATVDQVNEMLARLDPPEAYGKEDGPGESVPAAVAVEPAELAGVLCPQAWRGMLWIAVAVVAELGVALGFTAHHVATTVTLVPAGTAAPIAPVPTGPSAWMIIVMVVIAALAVIAPIVGTSLGWIAVERIKSSLRPGSARRFYGYPLAVFDALFYPLIVCWIGDFFLWYCGVVAYYGGTDLPNRGQAVCYIGTVITAMGFTIGLCWLLGRVGRATNPGGAGG